MKQNKTISEGKPIPPNGMDIGNTLTLRYIGQAIVYLADAIVLTTKPKYIFTNKIEQTK